MLWRLFQGTVAFAVGCAALSASAHADNFVCAATMSTGFKFKEGRWRSVDFDTSQTRYLVTQASADSLSYEVKPMGGGFNQYCKMGTFDGKPSGRIVCGGLGIGFLMDTETLRFFSLYGFGYLEGDKPGNDPSITLGTCAKVN